MKPDAPQTVRRSEKTRRSRFARIDNGALQDAALSFRTRGVLAYILSRPDSWAHSAERLAGASRDGIDAIRSALREPEARGYAELRRVRSARGSMVHRWYFSEAPNAKNPDSLQNEKPRELKDTAKKPFGEKGVGGMALLETTDKVTTESETTIDETTVGGASRPPSAPVSFPWSSESELPGDLADDLRREFPNEKRRAAVFSQICGRKLRYNDRHPLVHWPHVMRSEISEAARTPKGNSRGFASSVDYSDTHEKLGEALPAAKASDEPAGWRDRWAARFAHPAPARYDEVPPSIRWEWEHKHAGESAA